MTGAFASERRFLPTLGWLRTTCAPGELLHEGPNRPTHPYTPREANTRQVVQERFDRAQEGARGPESQLTVIGRQPYSLSPRITVGQIVRFSPYLGLRSSGIRDSLVFPKRADGQPEQHTLDAIEINSAIGVGAQITGLVHPQKQAR